MFYSTAVTTLKALYPENPVFQQLSDETRLIVSEPLSELAGTWNELPEASYGLVQAGDDEVRPFRARIPIPGSRAFS